MPAIEKLVSEHKSTLIAGDPQLNMCDQSVMVRILLKPNRIDNLSPFRLYDFRPVTHCSPRHFRRFGSDHRDPTIGVPSAWSHAPGMLVLRGVRSSSQCSRFPRESATLRVVSNFGERQNTRTLARLGEYVRGAPKIRDHYTFPSARPFCTIPHLKLKRLSFCNPYLLSLIVW